MVSGSSCNGKLSLKREFTDQFEFDTCSTRMLNPLAYDHPEWVGEIFEEKYSKICEKYTSD